MRIAVTGASGSIGTAFLRRCATEPDWSILGVARRAPGGVGGAYARADWLACDIGMPDATATLTEAFHGVDAVVHLAWAIHPPRSDPPMRRTNLVGTDQVLAAAARAGVPRVVFGSSVAAYRPADRFSLVTEEAPRGGIPGSAYSRDKAAAEDLLDRFTESHPDIGVARIRPCAVVQHAAAGQFARWALSPLLPVHWLGAGARLPVPLWSGMRAQAVHAGRSGRVGGRQPGPDRTGLAAAVGRARRAGRYARRHPGRGRHRQSAVVATSAATGAEGWPAQPPVPGVNHRTVHCG